MNTCIRVVLVLSLICLLVAMRDEVAAGTPVACALRDPLSCSNTNSLSWAPGFGAAISGFFGNRMASYFVGNTALSSQALDGLGGPPAERKSLSSGLFLFSACPAHNCGGQAVAVVLDNHGQIKAVGFSSFHCETQCDVDHRYLDFYVARGPMSDSIVSSLSAWGSSQSIRDALTDAHVDDGIAKRTVTHLVP